MNYFEILLPNEKIKTYNVITFIIISLNFFGFGLSFLKSSGFTSLLFIIGLLLNAVCWIFYIINKRHIKKNIPEIVFLVSAVIWMITNNYLIGAMLILFAIMGFLVNRKRFIIFSDDGIQYPSFVTKKFEWQNVNQVIYKDEILTIDLDNNQFIQLKIENLDANEKIDEYAFNSFCKSKIV